MHILDLIMYVILVILIHLILPEDFKEELGGCVGMGILFVFTIVYVVLFVFFDFNWIDIIHSIKSPNVTW